MTTRIQIDNVVLSNFLLVNRMDLLTEVLAGRGCVPRAVLDENIAGRAHHPALVELDRWLTPGGPLHVVDLEPAERRVYATLTPALGRGESACIAVAVVRGTVFASDDRVARAAAMARGVSVTGTIGVLIAGIRQGRIDLTSANRVLAAMVVAGFRSPVQELDGLLDG
jgi:predicted nucleic acid-binding protein